MYKVYTGIYRYIQVYTGIKYIQGLLKVCTPYTLLIIKPNTDC